MKVELHVHTKYSHDSLLDKYCLLMMCKLRGVDCIAITDHNNINAKGEFLSFLEVHGIKTILGEEIFTSEGEIIGLFLKDEIQSGLSPVETVKQIKQQGGLVYLPHPYDEKRYKTVLSEKSRKELSGCFDIVEMHNGRNISPLFSKIQESIADEIGAVKVIGSDAHTFFEIGRNFNVISGDFTTSKELLVKLRNAETRRSEVSVFAHTATKFVRVVKLVMRGDFNEIYRIINKKLRRC